MGRIEKFKIPPLRELFLRSCAALSGRTAEKVPLGCGRRREMKIIEKPRPTQKRQNYRKIAAEICGTDKAAFFEDERDVREFRHIVREMGLKARQEKDAGWFVWVFKKHP